MPHTITIESGQKYMEDILRTFGVSDEDGRLTAEIVLDSELRGYPDHGFGYFNLVVSVGYKNAVLNPKPNLAVIRDTPTMTLLDGDNGIGTVGSTRAMEMCIEKARTYGIAMAGVQNSRTFVAGAPYVMQAVEAGMIGFVCANIPGMAPPTGGMSPTFGTNPLAYGVPAGKHLPVLIDFSTTATGMGKMLLAKERGTSVEQGLAMHPDGRPLTDPAEYDFWTSLLLPMAGAKGYGLMMMVDVLSGVLTGSGFGTDLRLQATGDPKYLGTGQFMWVIDPSHLMPREEFFERMDRQIDQIKGGERLPGVGEILIPGERGLRQKTASLETGVMELEDSTWAGMEAAVGENGVSMPVPVG